MKDNNIVYWKTKNGELVSVDDMDINHLRNAFKHLIKHNTKLLQQANEVVYEYNALVRKRKAERGEASWHLNGDMANFFNDSVEDSLEDSLEDQIHHFYSH
jgi:hypothetical protein